MITPEQYQELVNYQNNPDRAATEWRESKGASWAARNPVAVEDSDESFMERYGRTKTWVVRDALREVPRGTSWFEVGCSSGAFLQLLRKLGFWRLAGVDISLDALRSSDEVVAQADALHLPVATSSFDGVATAGTLMHLGPSPRLCECLRELARVSRRWILLVELWAAESTMCSFGELLPPLWLFSWEAAVPQFLGPESWRVSYHVVYNLTSAKQSQGLRAPICATLLEKT